MGFILGYSIFNCTPLADDNFLSIAPGHIEFFMLTPWTKNSILKIIMISNDLLTFQYQSVIPWTTVVSGGGGVQLGIAHCI